LDAPVGSLPSGVVAGHSADRPGDGPSGLDGTKVHAYTSRIHAVFTVAARQPVLIGLTLHFRFLRILQLVSGSEFTPAKISGREAVFSICVLILVVWFGNFSEFNRFTLYADDWAFLGQTFSNPPTFASWFNGIIPGSDGRPIQFGLIDLTGAIINWTDSLAAAYLFLFLVTVISVLVTWWALTYRFSNTLALMAAAVFAISPLVSIRPFLNGIASPAAILFLMVAGILYASGWRVVSYLVAALILFSYEMVFPLFALLPALLQPLRTRRDLYRTIGHVVICLVMVVAYALFRDKYGSSRLTGAIAGHSTIEICFGIINATARSLVRGGLGSIDIPLWMDRIARVPSAIVWGVVAFSGFAYTLRRAGTASRETDRSNLWEAAQTVTVVALLMIPAGYALIYFGAPEGIFPVFDRESRFYSAANLPFSILTAIVLITLLRIAQRGWLRQAVIIIEAAYLGTLFTFSVSHQYEFVAASERQRLLVMQLAKEHSMMDPQATFIIRFPYLDATHLPSIEYVDGHSYYFLLRDLFDFSGGSDRNVGPAIRIVHSDFWQREVTIAPDGRLAWPVGTWPPTPELAGHIWYYEFGLDGVLRPLPTPIVIGGHNILHEGPDTVEGAVNLVQLKRLPYFVLEMGSEADMIGSSGGSVEPSQSIGSTPTTN
jgi:hypothetical protein